MTLSIYLADANPTFLKAAEGFLAKLSGVAVVGHAISGVQALAQIQQLHPDLVLLDFALPGISGVEVSQTLRHWQRPPRLVFVSMYDGSGYQALAHQVGAIKVVSKENFVNHLMPILNECMRSSERELKQ